MALNMYHVFRQDEVDYDEYTAVVVAAVDPAVALAYVREHYNPYQGLPPRGFDSLYNKAQWGIDWVGTASLEYRETTTILASYNAG